MRMIPILLTTCMAAVSALSTADIHAGVKMDASQIAKPATIKVLLLKQENDVMIEVKGSHEIYNPANHIYISSGFLKKRAYVRTSEQGLKWGEDFPGMLQIRIVPNDADSHILVNGIQYKGCVDIYQVNDKINVVNEIDIESYLKSVLTTQFTRQMDDTIMDAITILARTNAYYFISHNPHAYWHVEPQDGNYQGYGLLFQNLSVDRSVERTRHAILTYNNAPFPASWTKNSAGKTAPFSTIFRKEAPSPQGVEAPLAAKEREKFQWSSKIAANLVAKAAGFSKVASVDLLTDSHSNKVYGVKISDGFQTKTLDFFELQKAIGAQKIRSNDFTFTMQGDTLVFTGFGEGHGVGLCLYSAAVLAKHGADTPKILSAFFPNTQLQKVRSLNEDNKANLEAIDPSSFKTNTHEAHKNKYSLLGDEKCKKCRPKGGISEDVFLSLERQSNEECPRHRPRERLQDVLLSLEKQSDEECKKCRPKGNGNEEFFLSFENQSNEDCPRHRPRERLQDELLLSLEKQSDEKCKKCRPKEGFSDESLMTATLVDEKCKRCKKPKAFS